MAHAQPQPVHNTLRKVDQAMARLQEIQCTISGGSKLCGGVNLSPRSTRGYLRTSLRCKQESLRMKELTMKVEEETNPDQGQHIQRSSSLRRSSSTGEWRRWSMPALLIQQAVGEIMEASNTAKEVACLLSDSIENRPAEFTKSAQTGLNKKPLDDMREEQGSDSKLKNVLDEIERKDLNFGEKAGLQKFVSKKPENHVHKFKVIAKDASSTLKCHRKIEKEAESPKLRMRVQRQMSFQASDEARKQERMETSLSFLPVSHCSSPAKCMNVETTSAKQLVQAEQVKPAHKAWMCRSSSTKAIMFPNPTFVSLPLKNSPKVRSTNTSMRRKSLPSLKDLTSSKIAEYSPCYKEKDSRICTNDSSPKLRKSSSFSDAYEPNASKPAKQSSVSSLLNRTLKKFHLIKASALGASRIPSNHDANTKIETSASLGKSKSLRFVSSSQVQGFLGRRYSMSSCEQSAKCKVSQLSKQPVETLVQPHKLMSSGLMHLRSGPGDKDVANETIMMKVAEMGYRKIDSMSSERSQRETSAPLADDAKKQGTYSMENDSLQSSVPIVKSTSVNEMHCQTSIHEGNGPLRSPKQRLLRPIAMNHALNSFGGHESNMDAAKEKFNKQEKTILRKENRDSGKEDGGEDREMKKSIRILRKSWSFRHDNIRSLDSEKLDNSRGGFPFLMHVKEWMSLQRSTSSMNR